jgi:HPt (histidine-containing phosphotransfer) domain-containing protein
MFIDKVDENLSALVDCYEEASNNKELKQLAHALKSMCSSAGAYAAQQICDEIESQASLGERPDTSIISKLTDTIELTITEMSGMLGAPNDQPEMKAQEISA